MAAPVKPALVRAFGNESWAWVPAVADIQAPTVAEVTAATGFNLSCSLFGDQGGVTATVNRATLPRRMCETETFEVAAETAYTAPDFMVSMDPQGATGSDGKKAWEAMGDLEEGFLIQRFGVVGTQDFTAGEFVNVFPAQLGVKVPTKTANDASGVVAFTVGASVTDTPAFNVAIV